MLENLESCVKSFSREGPHRKKAEAELAAVRQMLRFNINFHEHADMSKEKLCPLCIALAALSAPATGKGR